MKYIFKPSLYLGLFFILCGCGRKNDFGSKVDDNSIPIALSEKEEDMIGEFVQKELFTTFKLNKFAFDNQRFYSNGSGGYGTMLENILEHLDSLKFVDYMHTDTIGYYLLGIVKSQRTNDGLIVGMKPNFNGDMEIVVVENVLLDWDYPRRLTIKIDAQLFKYLYDKKNETDWAGEIGEIMEPIEYTDSEKTIGVYYMRARTYIRSNSSLEDFRYYKIVLQSVNFFNNQWKEVEFSEITESVYNDAFASYN